MSGFKTKAGTELPIKDLRGKPYLQVAHRLVWFREERPDWSIETEIVERLANGALAKATIRNEHGRIISTGHKTETRDDFGDFLEKAETGAIGRALAACGYGTQFAPELEEGDRIVDGPMEPVKRQAPPPSFQDGPEVAEQFQKTVSRLAQGKPRPLGPTCCDKPMMTSKYDDSKWYCLTCKTLRNKDDMP